MHQVRKLIVVAMLMAVGAQAGPHGPGTSNQVEPFPPVDGTADFKKISTLQAEWMKYRDFLAGEKSSLLKRAVGLEASVQAELGWKSWDDVLRKLNQTN